MAPLVPANLPMRMFLRQFCKQIPRKPVVNNVRQYYGRRHLFPEVSETLQLVEKQMRDLESSLSESFRGFLRVPSSFENKRRCDIPIIKNVDSGREYSLDVDLHGLQPEDINISLKDNILTIRSKKEEKNEGSHFLREYNYQYILPEGVNPDSIRCSFHQGVLSIKAPLPALEEPKEIPIQKEGETKTG